MPAYYSHGNLEYAKPHMARMGKIRFMTRLRQAQTPEEQQRITEKMRETEQGRDVLAELESSKAKRNKEKDEVQRLREEARKLVGRHKEGNDEEEDDGQQLKDGGGTVGAKKLQPSRILDLEAMAFQDGGHHNSNPSVNLADGSQRTQGKAWEEVRFAVRITLHLLLSYKCHPLDLSLVRAEHYVILNFT